MENTTQHHHGGDAAQCTMYFISASAAPFRVAIYLLFARGNVRTAVARSTDDACLAGNFRVIVNDKVGH